MILPADRPPFVSFAIRSFRYPSLLLILALVIPTARLRAQDAPTLQVQSQLVVLDVVVTDKAGNVVTNLTQDDFQVSENGVLQTIRNFDPPHGVGSVPLSPTTDQFGRESWGGAPLTMIVVDEMDTPFEETAYSRQELERYLRAQPKLLNQPTILLWLNDDGIHPVTSFTRDRGALLSALESHKAALPGKLERGAAVDQLSSSLSAIQQITLFSRNNKGPKQIVWVGRSFPGIDATVLDRKQLALMHKAITSTMDLLLQARATLYVIDPTVAAAPAPPPVSAVGGPGTVEAFKAHDPFQMGFNFMSFVEETGGQYYYGRNDLNNEIEDSIARGTSFYSIAYVPTEPIVDGEYRKVDVHLSEPNLFVQTKQGYYPAQPQPATLTTADLEFGLREALVSGMSYDGIGVRLQGCQLGRQGTATCQAIVDNNSLTEEPGSDGSSQASLVAVLSALDKNSTMVANSVSKFTIKLPGQAAALSYTPLPLHLLVPANARTVRVAIRDSSGRIGTADLDFSQVKRLIIR